jgi:hypothetical protein
MRFKLTLSALLVAVAAALPAYADIAKPSPSPAVPRVVLHTGLEVATDPKAYEARLQISQEMLDSLKAALTDSAEPGMAQRLTRSSTRTMIAGIFMFLSISFAGVWFARSARKRGQKVVALLLLGAGLVGATAVLTQANAGPPGSYRWRNLPQNLSAGKPTLGGVDIEIVPEGHGMKLIMPLRPSNSILDKKSGE